ncbi:MAG: alpha-L-rhamnosidase N-terminal domain-containing protein, partial [Clostridia bacterium]|nr:alpha-L-rhamnosidase N-terminal domain-containing protein [Clostridia bacterium]
MMTQKTPLEGALWIGADAACESPVIRRRFILEEVKSAVLYITGLGYFEAMLNGKPVSSDKFVPVVTDYEPRRLNEFGYPLFDETTHRVYYYSYDVTGLLQAGETLLEVQLG